MELSINNFGPIKEAKINFGDLTFIIGPQASGKSLALELLKLILDKYHIVSTLKNYNFILSKTDAKNILDWYFGEGLARLFRDDTKIALDNEAFSPKDLLNAISKPKASGQKKESVFYVPAQRILSISEGRPRNFMEYDTSTPYVLRWFSETLRVFMQGGMGNPDTIFPIKTRLKGAVKRAINDNIFHGGKVVLDKTGVQRNMKMEVAGMKIPFMAWSAGQKEFMPLLLAIYCLSGPPTQVIDKNDYKLAVIEEPEMGLHPRAIQSVLLEIIELIKNGKRVIVSTHSTTFLEFVWAFNNMSYLPEDKFKSAMCEMFEIGTNTNAACLFDKLKEKTIKTFYSAKHHTKEGVTFSDISTLDAFNEDTDISEWGGLSTFSSMTSEIVSRYTEQ